jgi:hypothetical protein
MIFRVVPGPTSRCGGAAIQNINYTTTSDSNSGENPGASRQRPAWRTYSGPAAWAPLRVRSTVVRTCAKHKRLQGAQLRWRPGIAVARASAQASPHPGNILRLNFIVCFFFLPFFCGFRVQRLWFDGNDILCTSPVQRQQTPPLSTLKKRFRTQLGWFCCRQENEGFSRANWYLFSEPFYTCFWLHFKFFTTREEKKTALPSLG